MIRGADGSGGAKVIYVKARRRFKTITPKNVKGRERERSGGIDCDAWKCCRESLDVRSVAMWVCACVRANWCVGVLHLIRKSVKHMGHRLFNLKQR